MRLWALTDFGIRCVISTSFGDIFFNNSMKNGLVPIRVSREELDALMADAKDAENPNSRLILRNKKSGGRTVPSLSSISTSSAGTAS